MLTFDEYGDGIGSAWTVAREHAARTDRRAPVPTCPGWAVEDLVAHLGMVHRWAALRIRGIAHDAIDTDEIEAAGRAAQDQIEWLDDGAKALLQTFVDVPDGLPPFFLAGGPESPKAGWARRQAHETTIHAVDAMAASRGAVHPHEVWFNPAFAVDGIDEVLVGFAQRARQQLRSAPPFTAAFEATDTGDRWLLEISADPVIAHRQSDAAADATVRGSARALYLALWNRLADVTLLETSGEDLLDRWREQFKIEWR